MITAFKEYIESDKYQHILRVIRIVIYEKQTLENFQAVAKKSLTTKSFRESISSSFSSSMYISFLFCKLHFKLLRV